MIKKEALEKRNSPAIQTANEPWHGACCCCSCFDMITNRRGFYYSGTFLTASSTGYATSDTFSFHVVLFSNSRDNEIRFLLHYSSARILHRCLSNYLLFSFFLSARQRKKKKKQLGRDNKMQMIRTHRKSIYYL